MTYKNASRLILIADMRCIVVENRAIMANDSPIVPDNRAIVTDDGVQRAGIHVVEVDAGGIEKNVILVEATIDVRILRGG